MKEKLTYEKIIADIRGKKKQTAIGTACAFIALMALMAYITHRMSTFAIMNILSTIFVIAIIVLIIIASKGHSAITRVKNNDVDVYQDEVVKKLVTNSRKGTLHYLVFENYQPYKNPGVVVSDVQYDMCQLADAYYIICIKTTITNPYLLVYPVDKYMLCEELADKIRQ